METSFKKTGCSSTLLIMVVALFAMTLTAALQAQPPVDHDRSQSPYFFINTDDPSIDRMPLQLTSAEVNIAGIIADVTIVQEYKNEGKKPLEAIYIFPGSTRAAVYAMKMTIGERTIVARIDEKEKARNDYREALEQGKTASLLEQERPNVFSMSVANIMPGDVIRVEMKYTELLIPERGVYEFVYPTVVGPRYAGDNEKPVASAEKWVSNPYTHEGELPLYDFHLEGVVTSPVPIAEMFCPSHDVNISFTSKKKAVIALDETESSGGNRDFILRYRLRGDRLESGVLLYEGEEENFFLAMIQPPEVVHPDRVPPREYIFIMDVSGSMYGYPLNVSKELMKDLIGALRPVDRFNVLLFAGGSSLLSEQSLSAGESNLQKAIHFIENQQGGGGTELLPALERALALDVNDGYSRTFVIATDGYVTVERETFDLIRQNLGNANFFPFGIGTSVNRYIIEGMAHIGKGVPFSATNEQEAVKMAERFREYIHTPVLTNVKARFEGFSAYDVEPGAIPDVLPDRPVAIFGKWKKNASGKIILTGRAGGDAEYISNIDLASYNPSGENAALRYLWARERIRLLDDYAGIAHDDGHEKEITALGLQYNLLTRYTSFVAIDSEVRNHEGDPSVVNQPLPLPGGVSDYAVGACRKSPGAGGNLFGSFNGSAKNAATTSEEDASTPEEVFMVTESQPFFTAGVKALEKFIDGNISYPDDALEMGIEGEVRVEFAIDEKGLISDIQVVRPLFPSLDKEAVRIVGLMNGRWTPGETRGKAVKKKVILTIRFKI